MNNDTQMAWTFTNIVGDVVEYPIVEVLNYFEDTDPKWGLCASVKFFDDSAPYVVPVSEMVGYF